MDHYMTKYGSAVIYIINFTVSWTITQTNMEAFISIPIFVRKFLWMVCNTFKRLTIVWGSLRLTLIRPYNQI